ncbi:MAG: methyltransferase, FxLD system, partial [Pseudonocardiales bacterium]|nr:methyltransferase, FxLD system [Pseudonocardiales bacterium]
DWYEQGDIWEQIATHRTPAHPDGQQPSRPSPTTVAAVRQLLTAADDTDDSPMRTAPAWPQAFRHAGHALAELAHHTTLTRGLRALLAHHLLFSLNRLGISAEHQRLLATAASQVVFQHTEHTPDAFPNSSSHSEPAARVTAVTTDTTAADPGQLRAALADYIRDRKTFRTPQVEDAFRTVPRHVFLPGVDLHTAYAPRQVVTKRADDGTAVSSASSPNLVAEMLELLDVHPGHRVLEIGAATGINAALLAELTGPTGRVVTIELDDDLATGARTGLATAGYPHVQVICGDGALGHPARAPYDRITVTAGAWDISAAWWQQLAAGGRLVVPLRLHGSGLTRVLPFDLDQLGRMVSTTAYVCGFVPMRGTAEQAEHHVRLAEDVILKLDPADLPDDTALAHALTHPAHAHWTGIHVHDDEPAEHLDLWLATSDSATSFGRLAVGTVARSNGLIDPALRWAGASLYNHDTIAYIVVRPRSGDTNELGIVTHGPDSHKLTAQADDLLHRWHRERPTQPTITAHPAETPHDQAASPAHIERPHTDLTIAW